MNTIFTKPTGRSLTSSSKRHKKQRKEENMETTPREYERVTFFKLKKGKSRGVLCLKDIG
jgi:hypothetical protein